MRSDDVQTALVVLLVCGAIDLVLCSIVLGVVWIEHNRQRNLAALRGEPIPSAAGQFGCLVALGVIGFVVLYGTAWLLLHE
jgi:hypothetical protein